MEAIPILGSFLRKNHRALKLNTLILLDTLVNNYSGVLTTTLLDTVNIWTNTTMRHYFHLLVYHY